jgi:hypothetical protein
MAVPVEAYRKCVADVRSADHALSHALAYAPHEMLFELLALRERLHQVADRVKTMADPERTVTLHRVTA